jgi:two-component system, NarL family, response regulator
MTVLALLEKHRTAVPDLPMKKIRVLIVDEHFAVRQALAARLKSIPEIEVVATACSFDEGLTYARSQRPDIVLLEVKGVGARWPEPVAEMRQALADHSSGIIVLTSYADGIERENALQSGAHRYLLKQIDTALLVAEIETVAREVAA